MPRIYASNNDPFDFCHNGFPRPEAEAREAYGRMGDGPDGRGDCFEYDACHPPYDGDYYCCAECGMELNEIDDGADCVDPAPNKGR